MSVERRYPALKHTHDYADLTGTPPATVTTLDSLTDVNAPTPADLDGLQYDSGTGQWINGPILAKSAPEVRGASFAGGNSSIIVPTNNVPISIREDCTITGVVVLTQGGTGSCVLDIWKKPYGSYPATVADSITASAKPTITSGIKYSDTTLTGWTTTLSAGDTLLVKLESSTVFTVVNLFLILTPVGSTAFDGYTDERVRDVINLTLTDSASIDFSYDDPTDTITGTVKLNGVFEVGMIMQWYGLAADCPTGWAICDGTNGTPDMRDKFVVGAGSTYALNATGGSTTATGSTGSGGSHTPSGSISATTLDVTQIPSHQHFVAADQQYTGTGDQLIDASTYLYDDTNTGPGGDTQYILRGTSTAATVGLTSATGGGSSHGHNFTGNAVSDHTHSGTSLGVLPPYRALYFIMFIGV